MRSPDKPWDKGKHDLYTAFDLRVSVCVDEHGNVWSEHDFETPADGRVSIGLQQGGAPQIAHALLTEAVRREAFMCALVEQTRDTEYLVLWMEASDDEREVMERNLANAAQKVITRTVGRMTMGAVAEVLTMMAGTIPVPEGDPGGEPLG